MTVYLIQHGEALSREEDQERPLSERGRRAVEAVGSFLGDCPAVSAGRVVHSGRTRARETAEILVSRLSLTARLEEDDALAPDADPEIWRARLEAGDPGVMLVGHLPHLARLAALLLGVGTEGGVVAFRNGGMLCLEREAPGAWSVRWYVTPDLLRS
jgi:phosphohistidine phosphatase